MALASASVVDGVKYVAGESTHLGMSVSDLVAISDWLNAPQPRRRSTDSLGVGGRLGMHAIYFIGENK